MTTLTELYVVSHTHWDREWYHTDAEFRQRLVQLVDELLETPPVSGSFLLDGQSILLDDYLTVRPERAAELAALLRDGRLEAGPWYVLPDELIPSGEALVRNLMIGRSTVRRVRGEPPAVLYCPDSFGHPAALPDLAAGFGCAMLVLWRGFGGSRAPRSDVVWWHGAGGASVLVYHLPQDGYEFGSSLPANLEDARRRWACITDALAPRATTGRGILLNGADHHARQRDLPLALESLARVASPVRIVSASLADAARALHNGAAASDVPHIRGELRDSYGYTWTLQGTLATRAHQKRNNARAERTLIRDTEPWVALAGGDGASAARALLATTWRTLLTAHPHDTLCGTSVDAVGIAFDQRVASAERQAHALRRTALETLISHDAELARHRQSDWRPAVVLRNPVARARGGVVELRLCATIADVAVGPGSATRQGVRRRVPAWGIDGIPLQVLARSEEIALTESPRAYPDADRVAVAQAVGWVSPLGGYAVETRFHGVPASVTIPNPVVSGEASLDNGRVRVDVSADGSVTLIDHEMRRTIRNVIALERARDVGDSYTPAIRETLAAPVARRVRVTQKGPIRGEIVIDFQQAQAGRRGRSSCRLKLQLDADARSLRVCVDGENRDRDHRLRICFATDLEDAATVADAAFHSVTREHLEIPEIDAAVEHVVPTAPLHRWVARFTSRQGVALASDGLAEYESTANSICVTLVRSIGELSRADLQERPGHAGWPAPIPGAQCPGPYAARFALTLFGADSPDVRDAIERFAEDALVPLSGETLRSNLLPPIRAGGLELSGNGVAFSAAAPAEQDGWIMLRCVNRRDEAVRGAWRLAGIPNCTEAVKARLDETPIAALTVADGIVQFDAEPLEIVTILVR
ncbi:MAG: hypothetical protein V4550_09695 [Gemmatimonadota bacterium]